MVIIILSLTSLIGFTVFCRFLMIAAVSPVPIVNQRSYSKTALRVEKSYKVFSYGLMTLFFLGATATSFYQVFTQL